PSGRWSVSPPGTPSPGPPGSEHGAPARSSPHFSQIPGTAPPWSADRGTPGQQPEGPGPPGIGRQRLSLPPPAPPGSCSVQRRPGKYPGLLYLPFTPSFRLGNSNLKRTYFSPVSSSTTTAS